MSIFKFIFKDCKFEDQVQNRTYDEVCYGVLVLATCAFSCWESGVYTSEERKEGTDVADIDRIAGLLDGEKLACGGVRG